MSMMVSFVLSFFPRDVLDEILNLIESVSEDFPSYSFSNLRSSLPATAILPNANPPRSHHKTTKLPQAEIAEGSIFTAASAYGTAGDVSMIDSLENSVYMYLAFRQACTNDKYYDKTAHAQTDPHVSIWRESAFGGNLRVL